jgi:hypothetical protein
VPENYQADEKRPSAALPSSLVNAVPSRYAFFLRISGALHLDIFDQPQKPQHLARLGIEDEG